MNSLARRVLAVAGSILILGFVNCQTATPKPKTKDIGDSLRAFIIQDCQSKQKYCQVCAFSGKPTIMAVGAANDKDFESDLVAIQRVISSSQSAALTAFAVVGPFDKDGLGHFKKESEALDTLKAMRKAKGIGFPVVILPSQVSESQRQNYPTYFQSYDVSKSRTVFYAGADNKIRFAQVITNTSSTAQFKALAKLVHKK